MPCVNECQVGQANLNSLLLAFCWKTSLSTLSASWYWMVLPMKIHLRDDSNQNVWHQKKLLMGRKKKTKIINEIVTSYSWTKRYTDVVDSEIEDANAIRLTNAKWVPVEISIFTISWTPVPKEKEILATSESSFSDSMFISRFCRYYGGSHCQMERE